VLGLRYLADLLIDRKDGETGKAEQHRHKERKEVLCRSFHTACMTNDLLWHTDGVTLRPTVRGAGRRVLNSK
jgi:hypothetical protein